MSDAATQTSGPKIWLDMDQKALDAAYNQAVWAPNQESVHARRAALASECYARRKPQRFQYGETELEGFDFYPGSDGAAPVRIFIHGGSWRNGTSQTVAHLADTFCAAGAHFISMDFIQIDAAGGNLLTMVQQVRSGIAWIYKNAEKMKIDRKSFYVSGHSSGGHLCGCVSVTDWAADFDLPADILCGSVLMSGMFELEPVSLSARREFVNFTAETIEKASSIRHLRHLHGPVVVGYGLDESPEFQRQSRDMHEALVKAGKQAELIALEGTNHFEILESFHNPHSFLGRAALAQMGL
ncbi:MAG: alpha/beta hydrolase [Hyphomicrobiales bacterium]|nr:alpha/beta hydrolase [Hyphomicrobiales bacterium]